MVVNITEFDQLFVTQSYQVPVLGFLINVILAIVFSAIVSYVYVRFGTSLSNRRSFARNFLIIALTTTFIITVVKSSLALSLGLVGALSIVRFRTAIKDPEELAFLFITIAIGLGLGADQRIITFISVVAILSVIIVRSRFIDRDIDDKVMQLLITGKGIDLPSLEQITSIVEIHSTSVHLKRFDVNDNEIEVLYLGHFLSFDELKTLSDELRGLSGKLTISFLDSETG
jgi:membrane-associated HD superfamily phosphohydrolase